MVFPGGGNNGPSTHPCDIDRGDMACLRMPFHTGVAAQIFGECVSKCINNSEEIKSVIAVVAIFWGVDNAAAINNSKEPTKALAMSNQAKSTDEAALWLGVENYRRLLNHSGEKAGYTVNPADLNESVDLAPVDTR